MAERNDVTELLDASGVSITVNGELHLYLGTGPAIVESLARIEASLAQLQSTDRALVAQGVTMAADLKKITDALDTLEATVATDTDVKNSASTLLAGLSALLAANANDPVAVLAISARLAKAKTDVETSNAALAAAVMANTPA